MRLSHASAVLAFAATLASGTLEAQLNAPRRGIDHQTRMLINRARAMGKTDVIVLFVTDMEKTEQVVRAAEALGARLQARFDDVGYFRAIAPVAVAARLRNLPHVHEMRIDVGSVQYGSEADPHPGRPVPRKPVSTAPATTTPPTKKALPLLAGDTLRADGPFTHQRDLRASEFIAANPTYDGRGVTIGMVEDVGEFAHPALSRARNMAGDSIPKIAGVISAESYMLYRQGWASILTSDTLWKWRVPVEAVVDAVGDTARFWFDGQPYFAPKSGRLNVGRHVGEDSKILVAWDPTTKTAWIDTDKDHDFRNEAALGDINSSYSVAFLKRDSTAAKPRRSQSVVAVFDSAGGGIHLFDGSGSHATMVASVATGHNFLGGPANGVAPGARILYIHNRGSLWGSIEGYIRAARDPRVDVMTTSMLGRTYPINGETILPLILDRLFTVYNKPFVAAGGNAGPYAAVMSEPASTPNVIAAGAYVSREMAAVQFGWKVAGPDYLVHYSSRGPSGLGALKPDVLAPNSGIAATILSNPAGIIESEQPVYRLPAGYSFAGGTSAAAPTTAGSIALLISAAKQAGIPHDGPRVIWALRMGARRLEGLQVYEQGHGLIDIPRSWELLKRAAVTDFTLPTIDVSAPTRTRTERYHRTPGRGVGIYEREGWTAAMSESRTITLTRRTGTQDLVRYALRWIGNNGTFDAPTSVELPLNKPVHVTVKIKPANEGIHSAALELFDLRTELPIHRVGAYIVAANRLTPANDYTFRATATSPWPKPRSFFVDVPEGTEALRMTLNAQAGKLSLSVKTPEAPGAETNAVPVGRLDLMPIPPVYGGDSGTVLVPNPVAGVWEVMVAPAGWGQNAADTSDLPVNRVEARFELEVQAFATSAKLTSTGPTGAKTIALRNNFAPLSSSAVRATLASQRVYSGVADSLQSAPAYEIAVDSGTTTLKLDLLPADRKSQLDLYLYNCAGGPCRIWEIAMSSSPGRSITVREPEPGLWKAIVDPARVPTARTAFTLTEIKASPRFGSVAVDGAASGRKRGESWSVRATLRPNDLGKNQPLVALLEVIDEKLEAAERAYRERAWTFIPQRPIAIGSVLIPATRRKLSAR
jgi:hypothetical protein